MKKILRKKSKKRKNFEKNFLMIWSVVHFVITQGHFGAFIMPLRPHKASDQYPLKSKRDTTRTVLFTFCVSCYFCLDFDKRSDFWNSRNNKCTLECNFKPVILSGYLINGKISATSLFFGSNNYVYQTIILRKKYYKYIWDLADDF